MFCTLDNNGAVLGFFDAAINEVPAGAVEITKAKWRQLLALQGAGRLVDGAVVTVDPNALPDDMAAARATQLTRIRAARNAKWLDFDRRYMVAQRDGADMTALDAERQALKDAPESVATALESAATAADVATVWPSVLEG